MSTDPTPSLAACEELELRMLEYRTQRNQMTRPGIEHHHHERS
jgi:hypothetical protein